MSLSGNIKRLRLEKNWTQEQLATKLGVSAQAVSKWETSETYPDGALLVPLANELEVSLDELFGNDAVSMADISGRIVKFIHNTKAKERAEDEFYRICGGSGNADLLMRFMKQIVDEPDPDKAQKLFARALEPVVLKKEKVK